MARGERTEATVFVRGAALAATIFPMCDCKRRDAHEHGGRMREGWAALGKRCAAVFAWVVGGAARKRLPR